MEWTRVFLSDAAAAAAPPLFSPLPSPPPSKRIPFPLPRPTSHTLQKTPPWEMMTSCCLSHLLVRSSSGLAASFLRLQADTAANPPSPRGFPAESTEKRQQWGRKRGCPHGQSAVGQTAAPELRLPQTHSVSVKHLSSPLREEPNWTFLVGKGILPYLLQCNPMELHLACPH